MPSNNPGGQNGLFTPEPAYGSIAVQKALTDSAPMSGAPIAKQATEAPRRAKRQATRGRPAQANGQPQGESPVMAQLPAPTFGQAFATLATRLAAEPGAGPNIQWLAQQAQQQTIPNGAPFQGH